MANYGHTDKPLNSISQKNKEKGVSSHRRNAKRYINEEFYCTCILKKEKKERLYTVPDPTRG